MRGTRIHNFSEKFLAASVATILLVLANIRLQLKEGQLIESNTPFEVTNTTFANNSGSVNINVSDVVYKNYAMSYSGTPDTSWYEEFKDKEDTFVLSTAADLYGLAELVNTSADGFKGKTFKLGADITLNKGTASENDFVMSNSSAVRYPWTAIGKDATTAFAGTFDGQGNAISGLYVNTSTNCYGLFGRVKAGSTIQDVSLKNSYLYSSGSYPQLGSIVGLSQGTTIKNVYSDAYVNASGAYVGGLVGLANTSESKVENQRCESDKLVEFRCLGYWWTCWTYYQWFSGDYGIIL